MTSDIQKELLAQLLEGLHLDLAQKFKDLIENIQPNESGELHCDPRILQAARQFLSDNGMTLKEDRTLKDAYERNKEFPEDKTALQELEGSILPFDSDGKKRAQ